MSASDLPQEILSHIAGYVAYREKYDPIELLGPFALVNKAWQAAFEAQIYSSVVVLSPTDVDGVIVGREAPRPKKGLTFQRLDEITAGPHAWRLARRAAIRQMRCRVSVPHWLQEGLRERDPEEHTYDNPFRRDNDEAFERGVSALFDYLATPVWTTRAGPIALEVVLLAENVYTSDMETEPGTYLIELNEVPLAHYRANFPSGAALRTVSCVKEVSFPDAWTPAAMGQENTLSLPAQMKIVVACAGCSALDNVTLDSGYSTGRIPGFALAKRNSAAESLRLLPDQVRVLTLNWSPEFDDEETQPGELGLPIPSHISMTPDTLSRALRDVSMHLRELRIEGLDFTKELFSIDGPTSASPVQWPHLEILRLTLIPMATPTGEHLHYQSTRDAEPNAVAVASYFDELFASAGKAAQRMPRLKNLLLKYDNSHDVHYLELEAHGERRELWFYSLFDYSPDQGVREGWKVPGGELVRHYESLKAEYPLWPPP